MQTLRQAAEKVLQDWLAACMIYGAPNLSNPSQCWPQTPKIAWRSLYELQAVLEKEGSDNGH